MSFVHLENHSEYSMLHSSLKIKDLIKATKDNNQTAVALTDHGNMFGMLEHYFNAKWSGLNPIIGAHLYLELDNTLICKRHHYHYDRIIILAKNNNGYENLSRMVSHGHLEGFDQKPIVPMDLLKKNKADIYLITGDMTSQIGSHIIHGQDEAAQKLILEYKELFGDSFYMNLQDHGIGEQKILNDKLIELSKELDVPLVATNNNHYLSKSDAKPHEVLLCIDEGVKLNEFVNKEFPTEEYYVKSPEEMETLFAHVPEAIANTQIIADSCHVDIKTGVGDTYWPKYDFPSEFPDSDAYLAHFTWSKVHERYNEEEVEKYRERIDFELHIMKEMKVSGYMLIVQDFINWARDNDIPVGPGRGSAVGSIVCYIIGITDVCPMQFGLLFERFLNPERVSMPDIDTDFSDLDRQRVIDFVVEKYGKENVAQIITYGRMKAKMCLRDVGRALDVPLEDVNRMAKIIPVLGYNLTKAYDEFEELRDIVNSRESLKNLWKTSLRLEGLARQSGIHAAAVIIAPSPLVELVPLYKAPDETDIVIQYDKTFAEDIGLLKMDFLGLRTLSVIKEAVHLIKQNHNVEVDVDHLDLEDKLTFELVGKGHTVGVFQFESEGMQQYLKRLQPTKLEDMIAMNALYRPGPIEQIPHFINRKHGIEEIDCYHDNLVEILGETYGVIVYQEQVMKIAEILSGFTLGAADNLRRVMAKKKADKMAEEQPKFINGAVERGYEKELAEKIWEVLLPFCAYAFNKSHAAAYAYVAYQTAYLKAHYGPETMTAIINSEINQTERIVIMLNESKALDIPCLPPHVNESIGPFSCDQEGNIRYGMGGIKNVGLALMKELTDERDENGPYTSLFDLCKRLARKMNKRTLECLIMAGALDGLGGSRAAQYASIDIAIEYGNRLLEEKEMGQFSLFGGESADSTMPSEPELEEAEPWSSLELLEKEKQVLGLYLSGHPLEDFELELNGFTDLSLDTASIENAPVFEKKWGQKAEDSDYPSLTIGGIVTSFRSIPTKDNRAFGVMTLQDKEGTIEVVFWADQFEKVQDLINVDSMVLIQGKVEKRRDSEQRQFVGESVIPMEDARGQLTKYIHVSLTTNGLMEETLEDISMLIEDFESTQPNACSVVFHVNSEDGYKHTLLANKNKTTSELDLIYELQDIVGKENIKLSKELRGS